MTMSLPQEGSWWHRKHGQLLEKDDLWGDEEIYLWDIVEELNAESLL